MNYKSSMTDIGTATIASADKAEKAIIFDDFLITEADLSGETDLTKSTVDLFSSPLMYPINSKSTLDNTFTVKAVLANKTEKFTVDQDFHINAIGIMAHIEGDTDSNLMTIAVADGSGAVITAFKDTLYSLTVAITQAYQADHAANFKLANVAYALAEDLDKLKTDVQVIIDSDLTDVAKTNVDNKFSTKQTFEQGATDGKGNAYATEPEVSQGDASTLASAKGYTDAATANAVRTTDKLGGRNYVLDGEKSYTMTATGAVGEAIHDWHLSSAYQKLVKNGISMRISFDITVTNFDSGKSYIGYSTPSWTPFIKGLVFPSGTTHVSQTFTQPDGGNGQSVLRMTIDNSRATYIVSNVMLEVGAVEHDFVPATDGWQQQALFSAGSYTAGAVPAGSDYATYVKANFSKPGVYFIRDDKTASTIDGQPLSVVDSMLTSEGGNYYYASGVSMYGDSVYRAITPTSDTGWKRSVESHVVNIRADGETDANSSLISMSQKMGIYSVYIQGQSINNPSTDSIRGLIHSTGGGFASGTFHSNQGDSYSSYSVVIQNGTTVTWKHLATTEDIASGALVGRKLTAADDVYTIAPGLYTLGGVIPKNGAPNMTYGFLQVVCTDGYNKILRSYDINGFEMLNAHFGSPEKWLGWRIVNEGKVVKDNGNGTITVNGTTYAPVQSDPTSGNVAKVHNFVSGLKINGHLINVDPTNGLTIDGTPLINIVADEATAKAKSANDKLHLWVTKE